MFPWAQAAPPAPPGARIFRAACENYFHNIKYLLWRGHPVSPSPKSLSRPPAETARLPQADRPPSITNNTDADRGKRNGPCPARTRQKRAGRGPTACAHRSRDTSNPGSPGPGRREIILDIPGRARRRRFTLTSQIVRPMVMGTEPIPTSNDNLIWGPIQAATC